MFALVFRFPAGRYHATPWGRNVNEADVAWPPEPWRILRALIATYWRKGDRHRWSEEDLAALVDALAERPPLYRLPEVAVHTHTRHYMPAPVKTRLVFDAFVRLPDDAEIVAVWPELTLPPSLFGLADDLAHGIGYLGRAESWTECEARPEWKENPNCFPEGVGNGPAHDHYAVRLIAPRSAADYAAERERILDAFRDRQRQAAEKEGKKPPAAKALATAINKAFGPTLPVRLLDALSLDTSDYQRFGWNRPPASQDVIYYRKPIAPLPRRFEPKRPAAEDPRRFTVARYVLAGRPRPRIEDAVKIGELMRVAAMAKFGWKKDDATGRRIPNAPSVISGRDAEGRPLREPEHWHAFWLPEDADDDGEIDHIIVYAAAGFNPEERSKLDKINRLWISPAERASDEDTAEALLEPRQEWRLALEGFGTPKDFSDASRLLRASRAWNSVTPFLAAGHLKADGYPAEVRRLIKRRRLLSEPELTAVRVEVLGSTTIHGRPRRPIHFHRFRARRGEAQPDPVGVFLRLTFPSPVEGPLALGYASHFGLGMFAAGD